MTTKVIKINDNTRIEVTRYNNGNIETQIQYVNDKRHGMQSSWHENGNKEYQTMWADGVKYGKQSEWYESGVIYRQVTWVGYKKHGMERRWYEDGSKWEEIMWKNDKKHGMYTYWDEDNQKNKKNEQCGVSTEWYDNELKKRQIYRLCGKEYARIGWDEEGNVIEARLSRQPNNNNNKQINKPGQQSKKNEQKNK